MIGKALVRVTRACIWTAMAMTVGVVSYGVVRIAWTDHWFMGLFVTLVVVGLLVGGLAALVVCDER